MHLAYAAADAVLGRAGAMTVAEVSAVGLPAVYVPLPHGNGEQALNAGPVVAAGGGVLVADAELTGERVLAELVPLLTDPRRLADDGRRGPRVRARRRGRRAGPHGPRRSVRHRIGTRCARGGPMSERSEQCRPARSAAERRGMR